MPDRLVKSLIYGELTYKIRRAFFNVYNTLGYGHRESVYQNALEKEFAALSIPYEKEKSLDVFYNKDKVGIYRPDFLIDDKVIVELKPEVKIGKYKNLKISAKKTIYDKEIFTKKTLDRLASNFIT